MSTLKEKAEQILQEKETKIIPENLPNDVTIFDVTGGIPVYGGLSSSAESVDVNEYNVVLNSTFEEKSCYDVGSTIVVQAQNSIVANAIGLTPEKIKKDETILGVTGTLESDFNEYGNYINDNIGFRDLCSKNLWPHSNISPDAEIFGFVETVGGLSIHDTGANGVKLYGTLSVEKIIDSSNNPWVYILFLDNNNNVIGYASKQLGPTTQAWGTVVLTQLSIIRLDRTRVTIEELLTLSRVRLTLTKPSA